MAIGLHFFLRWNFERSFSKYVQNQELEQLDKISERLTNHFKLNRSWDFLIGNHHLWQRLHRDMDQPPGKPPRRARMPNPTQPSMSPPHQLGPRLVLLDVNKKLIIGGQKNPGGLELRSVYYKDRIIAYLGVNPPKTLLYARDRYFVKDQTSFFVLITFGMVIFSILLSYPVTMHLLRPINALTNGTRRLIAGQFKSRIKITTRDELGLLSKDFNTLAASLEKNELNRQQLVADTSHELRTPLAILRAEVEAIQDGIRLPSKENIAALHGEIMHLERLIGDLYALSKSDAGSLNYKKTDINIIEILGNTIDLFEKRLENKGLRIEKCLALNKPFILLADADRIQQLFTNILENSLRYTESPGTVKISQESISRHLVITFEDSAPNVPVAQLSNLFDRLYRVEESRNRATGGSGLGLAICKNIVDAHEGEIVAEPSTLGGVLIKISLPIK